MTCINCGNSRMAELLRVEPVNGDQAFAVCRVSVGQSCFRHYVGPASEHRIAWADPNVGRRRVDWLAFDRPREAA